MTTRVDPEFAQELQKYGVTYTGQVESTLPARPAVLGPAGAAVLRPVDLSGAPHGAGPGGGGLMSIGKSKAKIYVEADTGVTVRRRRRRRRGQGRAARGRRFPQKPGAVRPARRAHAEGRAAGRPARHRQDAARQGGRRRGQGAVLLDLGLRVRRDVRRRRRRAGARPVRAGARKGAGHHLHRRARRARPRPRHGPYAGGHDEKEQTLNQLLVELDGFNSRTGLVLLAATNRPEILDPALLRAGRFDRQVLVDRPDKKGRVQILQVHMRRDEARAGRGSREGRGADARASPARTSPIWSTRRRCSQPAAAPMRSRWRISTMRSSASSPGWRSATGCSIRKEREIVAYHEMGHALVALALPGADPVHKVSIIPRGIGALGYTIQRPTEDRFLMTREELENKMAVLLGGRAAELIVFGHLSTGAADDLRRVTDIARSMVTRYGMSEKLGSVAYERDTRTFLTGPDLPSPPRERDFGEETGNAIDEEVRAIVDGALERTVKLLRDRREILEKTAQQLLEKETLDEHELLDLAGPPVSPLPKAAE